MNRWVLGVFGALTVSLSGTALAEGSIVTTIYRDGKEIRLEVAERAGDLYLISEGKTTRLTNYGHNSNPVFSGNGQYLAYLSEPAELVRIKQAGGYPRWGNEPLIYNVWMLNLNTRQAWKVADQPANFRLDSDQNSSHAFERYGPFVTASGEYFAWIERPIKPDSVCSVVYYQPQTRRRVPIRLADPQHPLACLANGDGLNNLNTSQHHSFFFTYGPDLLIISPDGFKWVPLPGAKP